MWDALAVGDDEAVHELPQRIQSYAQCNCQVSVLHHMGASVAQTAVLLSKEHG